MRKYFVFVIVGLIGCSQQADKQEHSTIDPEYFGIESISEGYDSLSIRIWYIPPMAPLEIPVVTIKRTNGKWTGSVRKILMKFVQDTSRTATKDDMILTPFRIKSKEITPKSDWEHLLRKMADSKLFILPTMSKIPGLEDGVLDGDTFIVEIATAEGYRTYEYHVPDHFADKYWQAESMVNILDLIDTEFGMPWNWERHHWRMERWRQDFNRTADSVDIKS
jgi:hypothetical protein